MTRQSFLSHLVTFRQKQWLCVRVCACVCERRHYTQVLLKPRLVLWRQRPGTCSPRARGRQCPSSHLMPHHFQESTEIWVRGGLSVSF